jgi:hypothetical protein
MHDQTSPAVMRRMKTVSLLVIGAMIPLMLDTLVGLVTYSPAPGHPATWTDRGVYIMMLAGGALTMFVSIRVAAFSKLPRVGSILLLMALVVCTVVLSHFS